jgi:hypothetical protein
MIFGLVGIGFGTGLTAIVHALEISDIKQSLKIIYRWRINHINPLEN